MTHQQQAVLEQQDCKRKLYNFFNSNTYPRVFGLYGRAGTGKTQCINDYFYIHLPKFLHAKIVFTALSNKAVNKLKEVYDQTHLGNPHIGDSNFLTISKLLNKRIGYNNKGETEFFDKKYSSYDDFIKTIKIIVVDECSMLDDDALDQLLNLSKDIKIVLIGDKYQCPSPSGKDCTRALSYDGYTLETPYRYDDEIKNIVDKLRYFVDFKIKQPIVTDWVKSINSSKVQVYTSKQEFIDNVINDYKLNKNITCLAYRKDTVSKIASYVRTQINKCEEEYEIGDILICEQPYSSAIPRYAGYILPFTSCLYKVNTVSETSITIFKPLPDGNLQIRYDQDLTMMMNIVNIKGLSYFYILDAYQLEIESIDSPNHKFKICLIRNTKENIEEYQELKSKADKLNVDANYKNRTLIKDCNEILNLFQEFNHAFAINIYKSQGSTYDEVYVNLQDIMTLKPVSIEDKYKAIYTAMTRAKNKIHLLI